MSDVLVTQHAWGAKVSLNRPPVNAVSTTMAIELNATFAQLVVERPAVVVLTGAGEHFSAGADMKEQHSTPEEALLRQDNVIGLQRSIREAPFPVIAAVKGAALGLGMVMASQCDIRIAREDAILGLPEVKRGRAGGLSAVRPLVSEGFARLMAFSGANITADEAVRVGLAERLIKMDEWEEAVDALAASIAEHGASSLYAIKASLLRTATLGPGLGLWAEQMIAYRQWTEGDRHVWS